MEKKRIRIFNLYVKYRVVFYEYVRGTLCKDSISCTVQYLVVQKDLTDETWEKTVKCLATNIVKWFCTKLFNCCKKQCKQNVNIIKSTYSTRIVLYSVQYSVHKNITYNTCKLTVMCTYLLNQLLLQSYLR